MIFASPFDKTLIINLLKNSNFYFGIIITTMLFIPLSELYGEVFFQIAFVFERSYLTLLGALGTVIFIANLYFFKTFTFIEKSYITLLILAVLSVVCSVTTSKQPLFMVSGHVEELFHYFAYFFLFYATTKLNFNKHVKYLILAFLAIGVLHALVGIPQLFGARIAESYNNAEMHETLNCIYGLTSNCNFYASIATMFTAVACSGYLISETKYCNWKWLLVIFIATFCAIGSSTRLAILGVGSVLLFTIASYMILTIVTKVKKLNNVIVNAKFIQYQAPQKLIAMTTTVALACFSIYLFFPHLLVPSIGEFIKDFTAISAINESNTKAIEKVGSLRVQVWKFSIEYIINKNFWTGTGIGHFADVFYTNPKMHESPQIVNFAHNEYLHILTTQGIIAFIAYLVLFYKSIIKGITSFASTNNITYQQLKFVVLITIFSYMTQAFFNCNIFETYFYFWILLGCTYNCCEE